MKVAIVAVSLLAGWCIASPAHAQESCKQCRDFQRTCLTAHSKAACKTDYDICMKHCRQK